MLEFRHLVIREIENPEFGVGFEAAEIGYSVMRHIDLFKVLQRGQAG